MADNDTDSEPTSADSNEPDAQTDADDGWADAETSWTDSYVAYSRRKLVHQDGTTLWFWSGVEEPTPHYDVTADDEFAVELVGDDGVITGEAFEDEDAAEAYFQELRAKDPEEIDELRGGRDETEQ